MTKRLTGQTAVPLTCIDLPKHHGAIVVLDGPETAAQIVADHHAVPRLVEAASAALEALRYLRDVDPQHWDYHVTPEVCTAWDKLRAVLAATTTPPDAGEGRV
jgi:predicted HD phosphohydrolase